MPQKQKARSKLQERKIKKMEKLVNADLSNGRHAQKRLQNTVVSNGYTAEEMCFELQKLKAK